MRFKLKRTKLIYFILTSITFSCFAQTTDTIYFNKKWEAIPKNRNYMYFRIMNKENDSLYKVRDYYKEGQLQMTGAFKSVKQDEKIGEFIWYSKKGEQISLSRFQYDQINDTIKDYLLNKYQELKLLNSIKLVYSESNESGYTSSGVSVNGIKYGTWEYLNKKKELVFIYEYSNEAKNIYFVNFFNSDYPVDKSAYGNIWYTGYYKNNKEDSVWTFYFPDHTISRKVNFKNGKKIDNINYIGLGDWFLVKSKEFGFKLDFPKEPEAKSTELKINNFEFNILGYECDESRAKNTRKLSYTIMYMELPDSLIHSQRLDDPEGFFNKLSKKTVKDYGELVSEKDIVLKGYPGKEIIIKSKNADEIMTMRAYLIDNKIFLLGVIARENDKFKISITRFLDSFDLINNN